MFENFSKTRKKRIARISGIGGILVGLGMFFLFKNIQGTFPLIIGIILTLWGFSKNVR